MYAYMYFRKVRTLLGWADELMKTLKLVTRFIFGHWRHYFLTLTQSGKETQIMFATHILGQIHAKWYIKT